MSARDAVKVLDAGHVRLVESWGSDERIVEAARMSTAKGFLGWGGGPCPVCEAAGRLSERDHLFHKYEDSEAARDANCPCKGSGKAIGDEKLLRFLWDHGHATPFEMAGMIVEVKAPIFVFREWHRHRTQCLAGDTLVTCVSPRDTSYTRTIKSIFELKHGGVVDTAPARTRNGRSRAGTPVTREARRVDPWRTRVLPNCQGRTLRVLDESTGEFAVASMVDVWESGVKPLFMVATRGGHAVRASEEHPFFTRRGWVKMRDLAVGDEIARMGVVAAEESPVPPSLRRGIGVWTTMMRGRLIPPVAACYCCGTTFAHDQLELDHVVPVSISLKLALDPTNLRPICVGCHAKKSALEQPSRERKTRRGVRWERIGAVPQPCGEEMTYDLEVAGPHHNYVANGLVVHNSYNEMSSRYVPLPDESYVPSVERVLANAGTASKQASAAAGAKHPLTRESAEAFRRELARHYAATQRLYEESLEASVPKELARLCLPVARYSAMRASANLRNWLGFLRLRCDAAAQWEIRQYADAVAGLVRERFPRTYDVARASVGLP